MVIYVSLLVAFVGGLMYLLCNGPSPTSPKVAELGRLMFACGLLAFLLEISRGASLSIIR
jgi:hypothetical protein